MRRQLTREEYIKKAVCLRNFLLFANKLAGIFRRSQPGGLGKEVFIETPFGRVRTLWYGFEQPATTPVYFDLHGGGFVLGTADLDDDMNRQFQSQLGCKIISIDYAKAPEQPFPAAVNQIYAVIEHIHGAAAQYAVDAKRMAIGGHSAGANLAAVTCLKAQKAGKFKFTCQVLDYPPLDLATSPFDKSNPKGGIPPKIAVLFDACYVDPVLVKDPYVSPIYAPIEDLAGLPPALFILPGKDSLHDEGLVYLGMLKSAGVAAMCHEYPDSAHGFTYRASADTTDAIAKMVGFLKTWLQ